MKHVLRFGALACALCASACGGGGTASVPAAGTTPASSPLPSASTAPSPRASVAPAMPQASTSAIAFTTNTAVTFTVTEAGYTGAFSEADSCAPLTGTIAAVKPATGAGSYTVTPIGPGTCSIIVEDSAGNTVTVPVTVSAVAVTVQ